MSSCGVDIEYPPLADALYQANDLEEARQIYVSMLYETDNIYHSQYAAKLEHSRRQLSVENLKQLETDFIAFKEHMRLWSKQTGIQVIMQRRQKDFLGLNAKIRLFLASGKNLSQIHDLLGFRIILKTAYEDDSQSINHCYDALNEVFKFFARNRGYMFMEAEPRCGEEISLEKANEIGILIPHGCDILSGFENNVKDYILHPKDNGYQSLHTLISAPSGLIFEIQVRTTFMDVLAEYGSSEHKQYKSQKYKSTHLGDIDLTKINMPGFKALPNGKIYDRIGLQESIDPFNILY